MQRIIAAAEQTVKWERCKCDEMFGVTVGYELPKSCSRDANNMMKRQIEAAAICLLNLVYIKSCVEYIEETEDANAC